MCGNPFKRPRPPAPPPPLPPAPPPPQVPRASRIPLSKQLIEEVNPQVRKSKSKKTKSQLAKGSSQLKIALDPRDGGAVLEPSGGINNPVQ